MQTRICYAPNALEPGKSAFGGALFADTYRPHAVFLVQKLDRRGGTKWHRRMTFEFVSDWYRSWMDESAGSAISAGHSEAIIRDLNCGYGRRLILSAASFEVTTG